MLFTSHMVIVTAQYFPVKAGLFRRIQASTKSYLEWTNAKQNFRLFHSIPKYTHFDVRVVAEDKNKDIKNFGPLVPGLHPYKDRLRIYSTFARLNEPEDQAQKLTRDFYRHQLCNEIKATGFDVNRLEVIIRADPVRKIELIRRGQPMGIEQERSWGRFGCP